ncbi:MAG: 50S ribosomal protein L6 [archaeon]|jgi:large subunit ribosomal protein L6
MVESIVKTLKFAPELTAEVKPDNYLVLKGPKGTLERHFKTHRVKITLEGKKVILEGSPKNKQTDKLVETIVSHIKNMAEGLMYGYKYQLKVIYSHFPMSITVDKECVNIKNFLGEKFPRKSKIRGTVKVEVKGQDVTVSGISKDDVGQTASNLELKTVVKGKDIRRYQDGIYIVERGNIDAIKEAAVEIIRGRE